MTYIFQTGHDYVFQILLAYSKIFFFRFFLSPLKIFVNYEKNFFLGLRETYFIFS